VGALVLAGTLWGGTWSAGGCDDGDGLRDEPDNVTASPHAGRIPSSDPSRPDAAVSGPRPDAQVVLPIDDDPTRPDAASTILDPGGDDASIGPLPEADAAVVDAGVAPKGVSCDERKVLCKRVRPVCPMGQVPSVVESCWGDCAPIDHCACSNADECPERETYVCHMSVRFCGPYVN